MLRPALVRYHGHMLLPLEYYTRFQQGFIKGVSPSKSCKRGGKPALM